MLNRVGSSFKSVAGELGDGDNRLTKKEAIDAASRKSHE